MNDKPLKHEDYLAMATENQKLKAKIERMENKPAKRAKLKRLIGKASLYGVGFVVVAAIGFLGFVGIGTIAKRHNDKAAQERTKRHTPCYFTRLYGDEKNKEPWRNTWGVYKSDCDGCMNHLITSAPNPRDWFQSQDEAWAFMMKWNLPACK